MITPCTASEHVFLYLKRSWNFGLRAQPRVNAGTSVGDADCMPCSCNFEVSALEVIESRPSDSICLQAALLRLSHFLFCSRSQSHLAIARLFGCIRLIDKLKYNASNKHLARYTSTYAVDQVSGQKSVS